MKQKKSSKSNAKTNVSNINRSYFNPYETSSSTNNARNAARRNTTRSTYNGEKRKNSLRKIDTQVKVESKKQSGRKSRKTVNKKNAYSTPKSSQSIQIRRTNQKETLMSGQRRMPVRQRKPKTMNKSQQKQLKARRQMQFRLKVIAIMCMTVAVVWGGISLKESLIKPSISHQTVKVGTLDTATVLDGVIFRNEKIMTSEDEGYAKYIVAEGEKVQKDGIIYVLVDEENLATSTDAKEEVEAQIYNEAENKEATSNRQDERYNLDKEVKSKFEEFYNNRYDSSTSNIYTLRSQLDSSVTSRTDLYTSEQEKTNQELIALKQDIEANMENYQKGKAVTESGLISYQMDGFETEDAKAVIDALDYKGYSKYRRAGSVATLAPSYLSKEDPIYKIVTNNEWYVVTYIDSKDDQWTQGQSYNLRFDGISDQSIQFALQSKKEEENRIQLVFKTTNQIGKVLGLRDVSFTIGEEAHSGLKIPLEAIVELNLIKIPAEYVVTVNNVEGVYRKKNDNTEFIPINKQSIEEDMYYIVQDLTDLTKVQLHDTLILPEQEKTYEVTESEVSKGVYVINSQVAKFKEVEVLAQNEEYALVKYNSKSQLKEMDKIISNPKSIKQNQLLDDMKIQNE